MDSGVRVLKDISPQVLEGIRRLANTRVMVGIPGDAPARPANTLEPGQTPHTNAELGYINEFGEPALRIPPRPFLVPSMEAMQPQIIAGLHKAANAAVGGRPEGVTKALMTLGQRCASAVQKKITDGPFKPLAPYTIWKRQNRKVSPRMGTKPLLDFGHMRRAITYAIRNIGKPR
jgi:hypothetical protein